MQYIENNLGKDDKVVRVAEISKLAILPFAVLGGITFITGLLALIAADSDQVAGLLGLFLIVVGVVMVLNKVLDVMCTHLGFSEKRLIGKTGILNTKSIDAPLNKVDNISVTKGLFGLIFNYRSLKINTGAGTYEFHYIVDGDEFKRKLLDQEEEYERKLRESANK